MPTAVYCVDVDDNNFHVFEGNFACYFWKDENGTIKTSSKVDDSKEIFERFKVNHEIFKDFSFRTRAQVEKDSDQSLNSRVTESGRLRFFLAIVDFIFPVAILVFSTFLSPMWFTIAVFLVSLLAPIRRLRKIYQRPPKEKDPDHERKQKIKEYIYHCDRNPNGFLLLKMENLKEDARIEIQRKKAEIDAKKKE
ncbi:MAG: hypothetical protein JJU07_13040 [Natronohydrobacter sp.]|nr:hypothetical protein [Natronohydrobacter sp.]